MALLICIGLVLAPFIYLVFAAAALFVFVVGVLIWLGVVAGVTLVASLIGGVIGWGISATGRAVRKASARVAPSVPPAVSVGLLVE